MDPDVLPGLWSLSPLAALVGVLVTLVLLIARGMLIPARTHDAIVALYKQAAADSKEAAGEWRAAHTESNGHVRQLLAANGVVADMLIKADMTIDGAGGGDRGTTPDPPR